jgi:hypothetical protein
MSSVCWHVCVWCRTTRGRETFRCHWRPEGGCPARPQEAAETLVTAAGEALADCTSVAKVREQRGPSVRECPLFSSSRVEMTQVSPSLSLQEDLAAFAHAVARNPAVGRLVQLLEVFQGVSRSEQPPSSLQGLL